MFKIDSAEEAIVLLETLVETCKDAVVVTNGQGHIELFNRAAERLFKIQYPEVIGGRLDRFVPNLRFDMASPNNGNNANGRNYLETVAYRADGKKLTVIISYTEMFVDETRKYAAIIHDLTGVEKIQQELNDSQDMVDAIFEVAVDGMIVIDTSGMIQRVNPAICHLFKYEKSELIGHNVSILMPKKDSQRHDSYIKSYLTTGNKKIIGIGREVEGLKKNKETFPFKLSVSEFQLNKEKFFAGIIHDLTDQKEAERRLKEYTISLEEIVKSRTRELEQVNKGLRKQIAEKAKTEKALVESQGLYSEIAKNFPDGTIIVLDKSFRYVFAEGIELQKKKLATDQLLGKSYLEKISKRNQAALKDIFESVLQGERRKIEIQMNGQYYVLNAVPLFSEERKVNRILLVEKNITPQKKAEENIQKALEKERDLNELKSRFVSMASHEFRTPLSTVLSSVALAERYVELGDVDKQKKHFERIKNSVHNLTNILNDFLSLDKLETGRIELQLKKFNLHNLIHEVKEEMSYLLKPGQKITCSLSGENEVYSDPKLVKNIFINLISNASKYSGDGQEIKIEASTENGDAQVSIIDEGMGISEQDQTNLFERFFRSQNVAHIQGTGLGLNIVKKYLDLLEGEITFKSELHKGSTFTFKIPRSYQSVTSTFSDASLS